MNIDTHTLLHLPALLLLLSLHIARTLE